MPPKGNVAYYHLDCKGGQLAARAGSATSAVARFLADANGAASPSSPKSLAGRGLTNGNPKPLALTTACVR